ncbi:MAG: DUF1727 domain-containing protein [Clostridia bacterium]|nr:DUF1727 domain-containing protein [Clostridia bacterium]
MQIRLMLAVWACKLAIFGSRLLGKKGSSMPGQLAFKICPKVLKLLSQQVKKEIIVVCGTNGKTTTNNILSSFIKAQGYRVICNSVGANMLWGVCCAFAEKANLLGKLKADYACIEVDEASCVKVFPHMKPHLMVITNLFRDQLDRYGAIDQTADLLKRALAISPETKLLLNGDDPQVAQFGENTDRVCYYMGVDADAGMTKEDAQEGQLCMFCGAPLEYEYHHYSQLGKFTCPGCSFKRKPLDFRVTEVLMNEGLSFKLEHNGKTEKFAVNYRGFYNVYNIVLSYAAATLVMGEVPDYQKVLAAYKPQVGRMETFSINKPVILNMAKNPAGFNQAIATVSQDTKEKDILIAVNDKPSDGIDVSWLWDVDFERLLGGNVNRVVVSGMRADELMLRLKYAGFNEEQQIKCRTLKEAADAAVNGAGSVCYMLANYTAVFPLQEILKDMEGKSAHGE